MPQGGGFLNFILGNAIMCCDDALNEELKNYTENKPKAVRVGVELWKKLKVDDRITTKGDFDYLDSDIYVEYDLSLDDCEHKFFP